MPTKDPVLTPELIKILKIFGAASVLLVIFFSFFDSYRANNSGEDKTFRMTSSSRLFFLNLKAIDYQREIRKDAGMTLYRHAGFSFDSEDPTAFLVLILNTPKDECYLYLEPHKVDWPLNILAVWAENQRELNFQNGNKFEHFRQVQELYDLIQKEADFYLIVSDQKIPLWQSESEKEALKFTFEDYFRILDKK
ncbi:hypothetical protein E4S40_05700 [Algoriphagus kandeliae]|uniref:Uncharacterized protein n=1 Tax=Algoriphagus kandeliae TaxID=2562278 RepID=A0A4Y9QX54_9BACT|nr:hypothetical protein [Algoriphagus kandeliae]TFV95716.1 hypothetical protein E4S40_05700 [Algoriphagus kandeliae]